MGKPMKALLDFFTERAYAEAKDKDVVNGVIINEELFEKIQEYIEWAQKTIIEVSANIDKVDARYRAQIENANAQIRKINSKIAEINATRRAGSSLEIALMLEDALKKLGNNAELEVSSPYRRKDKDGKSFGGNLSTVSDPKLGKNRGGIITSVNDKFDYTGKYAQIQTIIKTLDPIIDRIHVEQQEYQEKLPKIDEIIAERVSESGKKTIQKNNGLKAVKVTQKTFLKKRAIPIMLALGISASMAVGVLRGTNVSVSGAHGNDGNVTGVEEQVENAQTEYESAYEKLGIDYQGQLEEQKTIHEFNGDPALIAEERKMDYQEIGRHFIEKEETILNHHSNLDELSPNESSDYFIDQYNLLIEQYQQILNVYDEDSMYAKGIIDSNKKHIDISNGAKKPNSAQIGLVNSLDENDIIRHLSQNEVAQKTLDSNSKSKEDIEQIIAETQKRIDFINLLKQQNVFKNIASGNFENVFESLFQMYSRRLEQISMEDFMRLIDENNYDLNIMAEYAKEEFSDLTFEESLARFSLINNSYKVYLSEYALDHSQVNISSYTQYANQYIQDNPEIGRDGGFITIVGGQFSQNDMNSGFYNNRQENVKSDGIMKGIFRNIKTIFNRQRRSEYQRAVDTQTKAMRTGIIDKNENENDRG